MVIALSTKHLVRAARHRRGQRGAALFLVVLVISLITAVGIFSMRSASLVNVASGYNRQNVQAAMLARLGARAAATYLNEVPSAVNFTLQVPGCAPAYIALDTTGRAFCNVLPSALISSVLLPLAGGLSGQLSVIDGTNTGVSGVVSSELTGTAPGGTNSGPGQSAASIHTVEVRVTTTAQVFPFDANTTSVCAPGAQEAISQQTVRATVTVPVP